MACHFGQSIHRLNRDKVASILCTLKSGEIRSDSKLNSLFQPCHSEISLVQNLGPHNLYITHEIYSEISSFHRVPYNKLFCCAYELFHAKVCYLRYKV